MSKAIHILLIDDIEEGTKDYPTIQAFQNKARDFGMKINHFTRGKSGLEELHLNPYKYKALILDARCIWDEKQQFPDDKFLTRAVAELERLEKKLNLTYPTVVNTGYIEAFQEERDFILSRHGEIFEKATDDGSKSIRIFEFLKDKIENSEEWKFTDVLDVAEKYLPSQPENFRATLLKVLKEFENPANNKSVLQNVRVIQDKIYETLEQKYSSIPNGSVKDKNEYLDGYLQWNQNQRKKIPTTTVYQTPTLSYFASSIFKTCSSFGSHSTSEPTNVKVEYWELPSNYAVKSVVFALLEQLIWFKNLMEKP